MAAIADEGNAPGLGGRAVDPGVAHHHDPIGRGPSLSHDAEAVGVRLERRHLVARDDEVQMRVESEALQHEVGDHAVVVGDRKSTRLDSSHSQISYAVFCLKKNKNSKPAYTTADHKTPPIR